MLLFFLDQKIGKNDIMIFRFYSSEVSRFRKFSETFSDASIKKCCSELFEKFHVLFKLHLFSLFVLVNDNSVNFQKTYRVLVISMNCTHQKVCRRTVREL